MYKILILYHGFSARSPSSVRGFEKSPRAPRRALGPPLRPSGIFQIPSGLGGIWAKIPSTKSEFSIQINFGRTLAPGTPV